MRAAIDSYPSVQKLRSMPPALKGMLRRMLRSHWLRLHSRGLLALISLSLSLVHPDSLPAFADDVDFGRDIRPILSDKCFTCHGPDAEAREADLRLDLAQGTAKVTSARDDAVPELVARVKSHDPDEVMPPPEVKNRLQASEIVLLERWVAQGAKYSRHWSFVPLGPVTVPEQDSAWGINEIDAFVLAHLRAKKIKPSPPASKERLIRRLSFDLTGLPPTLEEIDAYLDDDSPKAYEKLVQGYLGRTSYGERMTSQWLDVARYSDTFGYQVDRDRFVWPWRDWVIRAFNDNLPYDQFVTWQVAGDLLPNASKDQILATTFNRLHPQKVEGGSTPEEFRVEYVADRTQTFATAFLGLTLECARCHDHKYDPLLQSDYYQLFSFFNNIDEAGLYSYFTKSVPTPTLFMAGEAADKKMATLEAEIEAAEKAQDELRTRHNDDFDRWFSDRLSSPASTRSTEIAGSIAHLDFENHKSGANLGVSGKIGQAVQLSGDDGIGLKVGNFARYEPFSVALWMNTPDVKERAVVFHRSRAWTDAGSRGYQLLIEDGKLSASLIHFWPGNAIRVRTKEAIPTILWIHVAMTYDGSSRASGLRIYVNGSPAETEIVRDNLYKNIRGGGGDNITIGQRFRDRGFTKGMVDEFRVFSRELTAIEVAQIQQDGSLDELLATPRAKLTTTETARLREFYLSTRDETWRRGLADLRELRKRLSTLVDPMREIMVMREMPRPRPAYVLRRGLYSDRMQRVSMMTPAALPPYSSDLPRNRLGLSRWLTQPGHPLTARVAVNRFWQLLFGDGLVRTPEDFGSQGAPPTHPELLDWLAHDFATGGWNIKKLIKTIVLSATYRQDSRASEELLQLDPENRLLARAPSYRLAAEMIRDNALAVSGLLATTVGGKPARPYEVAVSFKPVGRDKGEGLYRRSLYTYWKRTGPAPMMMSLDAAKRDVCTVKRERTASPIQAFILLNGTQFVEAARVFGEKLVRKHQVDIEALIVEAFRSLTSRRPTAPELAILRRLHDEQSAYFRDHEAEARKFLATGDAKRDESLPLPSCAAAAMLCSAIMNFDESVMKR